MSEFEFAFAFAFAIAIAIVVTAIASGSRSGFVLIAKTTVLAMTPAPTIEFEVGSIHNLVG
jgi:hypothetical protein